MKCDVVFKLPAGLSQDVTVLVQTDEALEGLFASRPGRVTQGL